MPTFHHANLGIPPDLADAEADFLTGILGYRRLEPPQAAADFGARWFEADDGTQVHLSLDPAHAPAATHFSAMVNLALIPAVSTLLAFAAGQQPHPGNGCGPMAVPTTKVQFIRIPAHGIKFSNFSGKQKK